MLPFAVLDYKGFKLLIVNNRMILYFNDETLGVPDLNFLDFYPSLF